MFLCLVIAPRHLHGRSEPIGGGILPDRSSVHGKLLGVPDLTPLGVGGFGPIGLQFACKVPYCRTDTGQCCIIVLSGDRLVCPASC